MTSFEPKMIINSLSWYSAERDDLPEVAFGLGDFYRRTPVDVSSIRSLGVTACVAFARDRADALDYHPPAMFVLDGVRAAETLSWLRVFAKGSFPLSQFGRVMTDADWLIFSSGESDGNATRTDRWASIILGELLAQGEPEVDLDNMPISRASACFSTAIARAIFLYDSVSITRTCSERLRVAAEDSRFTRRSVSVDALAPIWAAVSARIGDTSNLAELTDLVLHAVEVTSPNRVHTTLMHSLLRRHGQLFSDSVEERVLAFQRLSNQVAVEFPPSNDLLPTASALVAVAAFLVGRGTSHAFLLRKIPNITSSAFLWFGLLAALIGPRGWDPSWMRVAKGIEKQVRSTFSWNDPPSADLCWTEYSWLAKTFSGAQAFSDLARATPRTLSIEIIPGATCQFRMLSESKVRSEGESGRVEFASRESDMRATLEALILLSNKARQLLGEPIKNKDEVAQGALELESGASNTRGKAKKSSKKSKGV